MKKRDQAYQRRWSNLIVNRTLQFRYAGIFAGFSLVISVLFGFFLFYQTDLFLDIIEKIMSPEDLLMAGMNELKSQLCLSIIIIICVNTIVLSLVGVCISHAVAGPIWRMEKQLKKLAEGDLGYIYFRKTDLCPSLQEHYNNVMDALKKKNSEIISALKAMEEQTGGVSQELARDELEKKKVKDALKKINQEIDRVRNLCS